MSINEKYDDKVDIGATAISLFLGACALFDKNTSLKTRASAAVECV